MVVATIVKIAFGARTLITARDVWIVRSRCSPGIFALLDAMLILGCSLNDCVDCVNCTNCNNCSGLTDRHHENDIHETKK